MVLIESHRSRTVAHLCCQATLHCQPPSRVDQDHRNIASLMQYTGYELYCTHAAADVQSTMFYFVALLVAMQLHSASTQCTNGGQLVARGCTSSDQCTLYTNGQVICLQGSCCTVPSSCSNGGNMVAIGCSQSQQCARYSNEQTVCLSGKCCTVGSAEVFAANIELYRADRMVLWPSAANAACLTSKVPRRCPNGGTVVALGCYSSQQCVSCTMSVGLFIVHIILYQICCSLVHAQCPSDSVWVAHDCNSSSQCTPYASVAVRCVDGECCTLPGATKCENGGTAVALFCTVSEECLPYTPDPVACLSRTCCTVSGTFCYARCMKV
ncbi:unnamed protein product [Toxocara canis]|uniref:EB domain-containing protein n=1 Tax=Toxocara canis TaxID=6265 RepID=A0A183UFM6_TOXCA|nr:unnamed protein product [Toxocara canis]